MLAVSLCHTTCPHCRVLTDFQIFESGSGGDFSTYEGIRTGALFRLKLDDGGNSNLADRLAPAIEREAGLRSIPEQVKCKVCKTVFAATKIAMEREGVVEAFEL
jgi:hypothetical protein